MIRALSVVQAGSTRARRAGLVGVVAGALVLSGVVPAVAAVTTTPATSAGATALAQALAGPGTTVTGASYVSVPTTGAPNGTSNAAIGTFPTKAPNTFAILTTGSVANVTRTSGAPTTGTDLNTPAPTGRGTTVRDTTVLKVDLTAPVGANCLTFDFKFLTQEFPTYVGQKYNDGFVAELDRTTWTTATSGAITAPDDFALDTSSKVVSVNATGVGGLSAANGAGTEFNGAQLDNSNKPSGGATGLLQASKQVSPGAHSVYFSIFDQGDGAYDSAVFLHGLTVGFVPNPATNCVPGATPVNYQATMTPTGTSDQVGTPHTVTTTLTDSAGAPVANAAVGFTVSGANPTTGTGTTNGSGQASFTYTGSNHGKDQIAACYQPTGATTCLATTSVTEAWTAPVTVTADNQQITFGGVDPTFTATVTGLSPGDSLTTAPTCGVAGAHTHAGSYPITCAGATAGPDYTVSAVAGTLTVSPAPVQIVVDNLSRTYGAPDPNPTYSVNGAPASVLTTLPTCTITGPDTVVGSYPIVCSGADAGPDYTITSTPGTLTVGTAAVTVTADSTSRVYGTPDPTFTATTSGLVGGDALTRAATCGVTDTHTAVGTYAITCSGADAGPNYSVGYASGTLTVTQAAGTVTPAPQSAVYGSADPTFAYTVSGLVGTDALTSAASCGVAGPHRAVGTYPITCSGGSAGANYTLTYGTATYTVTPAPLTVTADNVARVYDGTASTTSTATTAGLLAGDTLTTAPTCSVAAAHTAAGTYVITCTGADAGPNYAITYVPGTLTVGKASVTVTAKNASRTYGAPDPALTGVASGLVGSDSLVTPAGCSVAGAHAGVGSYAIACSGADAGPNYTVGYVGGTLTVTPAAATVTAPSPATRYGVAASAVPLAPTVSGLVNGDTAGSAGLTGVACSTSATRTAGGSYPAGSFPVACTGPATTPNYTVSYAGGTLTVAKATLTFTGSSASRVYGTANPALGATATGLVNGDSPAAAFSGAPVVATTATTASHVGAYPVTVAPGTLTSANYAFAFVPGTLTVTAGTAALTANAVLVTLAPNRITVSFGTLSAVLTNAATKAPVAGQTLVFGLPGGTLCTAVTDANGLATCRITALQEAAVVLSLGYTVTAPASGDLGSATARGTLIRFV